MQNVITFVLEQSYMMALAAFFQSSEPHTACCSQINWETKDKQKKTKQYLPHAEVKGKNPTDIDGFAYATTKHYLFRGQINVKSIS